MTALYYLHLIMTKTILLLDDDPDELEILHDAFTAIGADVALKQFLTFPALLSHLQEITLLPDMLLLDVNLPQQNGLEAIRIIKSSVYLAPLPIVMYSNAADEQTIEDSFAFGAGAYMKKTTSIHLLKENLQLLLAWNLQTIFNLPISERTLLN